MEAYSNKRKKLGFLREEIINPNYITRRGKKPPRKLMKKNQTSKVKKRKSSDLAQVLIKEPEFYYFINGLK